MPLIYKSASGAAQLANLSTKSHIGSPDIGLISAVKNPQNVAQTKTNLSGLNSTIIATVISSSPTRGNSFVAADAGIPTEAK